MFILVAKFLRSKLDISKFGLFVSSIYEKKVQQKYGLFLQNKCLHKIWYSMKKTKQKKKQTQLKAKQLKQNIFKSEGIYGFL